MFSCLVQIVPHVFFKKKHEKEKTFTLKKHLHNSLEAAVAFSYIQKHLEILNVQSFYMKVNHFFLFLSLFYLSPSIPRLENEIFTFFLFSAFREFVDIFYKCS